jgi:bifunctional non-homologous end joining protein LigD
VAKRTESSLEDYRRKRDPERTNEPFAPEPVRSEADREGTFRGSFVCHLHDTTRRHYDLRIESGGALLSFAVPKGPSLDPSEKRLAVQTEAHPLDYLDFERVIPDGNYGAGAMIAWDRGRIRYLETSAEKGVETGKIDFELAGQKLKGRFALVRTSGRKEPLAKVKQPEWLLIKKKDAFSREEGDILAEEPESIFCGLTVDELPRAHEIASELEERAASEGAPRSSVLGKRIVPMLCSLEGAELSDGEYLYELKLDGVRIIADRNLEQVGLSYRTGRPATASYPEVADAMKRLCAERVVLDGEVIAFDERGKPDFQRLARRIHAMRPTDVRYAAMAVPVTFLVFDILALGDHDLRSLPLSVRKEILSKLVPKRGTIRAIDYVEGRGDVLFEFCRQNGLEGVVGKRLDSPYREGPQRYPDWVKFKCERDAEFVVVGYTVGSGGRARLGALDIAAYEGEKLVVRGRVGSGIAEKTIDELLPRLEALKIDRAPAEGPWESAPRGRTYVKPEIVVSVRYGGFSDGGRLRFPVYRGERNDVDPKSCTCGAHWEEDDGVFTAALGATAASDDAEQVVVERRAKLTNQDKVFWPDAGYTKGDLCDYYAAIAPVLLPYLKDRPVVLVRYPDGIAGKSFYQWRVPPMAPKWVRSFPVRALEEDGKEKTTFIVDGIDTLLYIANLGCIPLHVLAGRVQSLDACDFLTVDFDLADADRASGTMRSAIVLARALHDVLDEIGLDGFPKTSGQTGLHVLVPLGPGVGFETAKMLAELLGRIVQSRHPDVGTMERVKEKRGGRAYIDTGQTGRSRTIVAPYSVRAYPGARVSAALTWDEVSFALDPKRFTIFTVLERVERIGDPMKDMLVRRPDVAKAVEKLAALLPKG